MPRVMVILMVVVGMVFVASLAMLISLKRHGDRGPEMPANAPAHAFADPLTPAENAAGMAIPEFTLTTQDGGKIDRSVFDGRVTVVDFFFTHCVFVCPLLTERMQDLNRSLKDTPVRFLSVSVDPAHDTPEVLGRYAAEHGADPTRWTFATGDKETIGRIVTGGLKFAVGENPDQPIKIEGGETMSNILHPPWFALIGPKGEVLDFYRANLPESEGEMEALAKRARAAAAKVGR